MNHVHVRVDPTALTRPIIAALDSPVGMHVLDVLPAQLMLATHVCWRLVWFYLVLLQNLGLNDLATLFNELFALLLYRERAQMLAYGHALRRVVDQLECCVLVEMHACCDNVAGLGAKHTATVACRAYKRALSILVVN